MVQLYFAMYLMWEGNILLFKFNLNRKSYSSCSTHKSSHFIDLKYMFRCIIETFRMNYHSILLTLLLWNMVHYDRVLFFEGHRQTVILQDVSYNLSEKKESYCYICFSKTLDLRSSIFIFYKLFIEFIVWQRKTFHWSIWS